MQFELNSEDYETLLLMMGMATGAAMRNDRGLAYRFIRLLNKINENNPQYTPYEIPEEHRNG